MAPLWSHERHAKVVSNVARIVMFLFLLAGLGTLATLTYDRHDWLVTLILGLVLTGIGIAAFFAKPIRAEHLYANTPPSQSPEASKSEQHT